MRDGGAKACSNRTSKFTAQTSRFRSAEINKIRDRMNSKGREKQRENGPPNLSHLLARPVHNYPPFFHFAPISFRNDSSSVRGSSLPFKRKLRVGNGAKKRTGRVKSNRGRLSEPNFFVDKVIGKGENETCTTRGINWRHELGFSERRRKNSRNSGDRYERKTEHD